MCNHRSIPKWSVGQILRQKGPVSYLVRVGSKIRYCHVDHLLKSNVPAEDAQPMPKRLLRERRTSDVFFPADNEPDIELENTDNAVITMAETRQSARTRQPPKRLIEEMDN